MKRIIPVLSAAVLILCSCSQNIHTAQTSDTKTDSIAALIHPLSRSLFATMRIKDSIKAGDQVMLKFTVYNKTDSVQQFCKWHTPFEPLMSKYLEIKEENGEEAAYQGPMAKRIMPPPADSYLKVNPGDSLSVDVDVLKAYAIKKPANYSVIYTGQGISGLIVRDSVVFAYGRP